MPPLFRDYSSLCFLAACIAAVIGVARSRGRDTLSWALFFLALGMLLIGK